VAEGTYYSRRAARDPGWREEAIVAAAERYRRAKERDPELVRQPSRDYRERLRRRSLTITQLAERTAAADLETLRFVLRDEVRRGRIELVQGRYYRLNGVDPELRAALLLLRDE
jgi:hypothetical protein